MEALTGAVSGDDWNHSQNQYNVAFMKGSFPQHESSVWLWGDEMDQSESSQCHYNLASVSSERRYLMSCARIFFA